MSSTDSIAEEWRDIPGYEGIYQASSLGRIKSLHRGERILVQVYDRGFGYAHISLSKDAVVTNWNVHRLIALAFLGAPGGRVVRHLDGVPTNNRLSNLAWGTPSENTQDMLRHGHHRYASRNHCSQGHEYTPENTSVVGRERRCKKCYYARAARYRAARRAA